jgi:hypothetical protein
MLLASALLAGCAGAADGNDVEQTEQGATADPLKMPTAIVAFEKSKMWGMHHLEWHTERQWDLLSTSDRAWAEKQMWKRADVQEGENGNGLEFLAMHRAMIQILVAKFPANADLFKGWSVPPTDPRDKTNALPHGQTTPFDAEMLKAIAELETHVDSFASDDELGLYIETKLRPITGNPEHRSADATTGIHNYMHNRFEDPSSKINIGDPSVNLQNQLFWRLHGWIDARWTAFRAVKHLRDDDPAYAAAMKKAHDMMDGGMHMGVGMGDMCCDGEDAPASLRQFFARPGT